MPACSYSGAADNLRIPTGIAAAQAANHTGKGVKVAFLDTEQVTGYAPLSGRISSYTDFTGRPADTAAAGKSGHGALMGALIGGSAGGGFNGGAAPDAELHWGRVCAEDACASDTITKGVAHYIAANVRLFNLSLGTPGSAASATAYQPMADYIVSADALLVAATGNAGREQPDNPAGLPVYLPQYRNNWLAVANVRIGNDGQAAGLNSLSNACGDAAAFCLVAPGLHQVVPVAGTAFANSHYVDGTSASTAVVTGAAALVWQAFPWMSASNVQQTLLTTAVDLGEKGVDPLYGWGMLDAGKAVNGPAQFTGNFTAELRSGQSGVFANAISGNGGLLKRGNGQLTLQADNTYTGPTTVEGGRLRLAGDVAGDLTLLNQSQLQADGGRIGGNYRAGEQAVTIVRLGQPLQVAGSAALGGALHLLPETAGYTVGSQELLLQAAQLKGQFDHVTYANDLFWSASLEYGSQQVTAQLTRTSATTSALSLAAPAAVVNGAGQADVLLGALDQQAALGGSPGGIVLAANSLLRADTALASTSLATLSAPLLGMEHQVSLGNDLHLLSLLADQRATGDAGQAMHLQAIYQEGRLSQPGYGSGSWHTDGFQAGAGFALGDNGHHYWGLAVDNLQMRLRAPQADHSSARHTHAHLWWQWQAADWQLGVIAGHGRRRVDNTRRVIAGQLDETLHSRRRDRSSHLRLDLEWRQPQWLRPYLAAGWIEHKQGRFDENSRLGLGLRAAATSRHLPFAETGLRAGHTVGPWDWSGTLAYQRLLGDRDLAYNASFDGLTDNGFSVAGLDLAAERWRLGLQVRRQVTQKLSWQASAHTQRQAGSAQENGVQLGLHWAF